MKARGPLAVLEVHADPQGAVPVGLVRAAYRASRAGTVVLLLGGVSPAQVDRVLDPLVRDLPGVAGVVYATTETLESVLGRCGRPGWAVVASGGPARILERQGVRVRRVADAWEALMAFEGSREKLGIVTEMWTFMRVRKAWWLAPIAVTLGLLGLLVVFTQGSAVAPFIYTLF